VASSRLHLGTRDRNLGSIIPESLTRLCLLRLELTCDDEPLVYCAECWEREFGDTGSGPVN